MFPLVIRRQKIGSGKERQIRLYNFLWSFVLPLYVERMKKVIHCGLEEVAYWLWKEGKLTGGRGRILILEITSFLLER